MRLVTIILFLIAVIPIICTTSSNNDNKAHLRTISWYRQRPHNTALYDVLNVRYDASSGEIAKSYRRLSLEWHPDKIRKRKQKEDTKMKKHTSTDIPPPPPPPPSENVSPINDIEEYARDKLAQISNAYEILSNDQTRLLYHRYGIQNGVEGAIQLLTGKMHGGDHNIGSNEQSHLLQLMGYPPHLAHDAKEARICYLTSTIIEKLRPLVEGTISQDMYAQSIYDEYTALSKSALGKQILRCTGRAYKREGYRVLRTMNKRYNGGLRSTSHQHKITDVLHDSWSSIRHLTSAAVASGKLALVETKIKKLKKEKERKMNKATGTKMITTKGGKNSDSNDQIFLDNIGTLPDESDEDLTDEIGAMFSDDEEDLELDDAHFQHLANEKTYNALLTAHQTEVLWKLTKIDLDSTIREACRRMLRPATETSGGWYSFFPSEQSPYPNDWNNNNINSMPYMNEHHNQLQDGWVGLDGNVIQMEVGRLRAAAALVLVGNIMVCCGKEIDP